MPGIVGLITAMPREGAERELLQMVGAIRHEPFYVTGTLVDPALGLYVGWTAREGSFSDGMPVRNERQDVSLVFAGEDFPESGTGRRLRERGHACADDGSHYLVHLYEDDPAFPAGLNGRFHGLLADRARQIAVLFNDRYGLHRVYYHEAKDAFYFAAEAKAILKVRPELRKADVRGMGEFVACGCVLENRTLFEAIHVLPPASNWIFRGAKLEKRQAYFSPKEWEDQQRLEPEPYYHELRNVFERNLPRYFAGRERIGMSLTGGLDTRMVMAWQKNSPGSLPCYSFGGMFRDSQDIVLARQIAKACGQTHQVIRVADEFLSSFPRYAERSVFLADGCIDVSHSADLYVNELAATIAPARMTGNYGGEVLRRVVAFKPVKPVAELFVPDFLCHVAAAETTYAGVLQGHPLSFAVFRQAPWHHYGLLSLEQTQLTLRSPYLDNDFVRTVFRAPQSACTNNEVSRRLIGDGNTALTTIRTDRGPISGCHSWRAAAIRSLIDLTVKAEYAYDYGMPQWLARIDHLCSPLPLERLFLGRHKFYHYRAWYKGALAKYVREMLLDPRTLSRDYVQPRQLETLVHSHLKGYRNYTSAIHTVLTLELVSRIFLD